MLRIRCFFLFFFLFELTLNYFRQTSKLCKRSFFTSPRDLGKYSSPLRICKIQWNTERNTQEKRLVTFEDSRPLKYRRTVIRSRQKIGQIELGATFFINFSSSLLAEPCQFSVWPSNDLPGKIPFSKFYYRHRMSVKKIRNKNTYTERNISEW